MPLPPGSGAQDLPPTQFTSSCSAAGAHARGNVSAGAIPSQGTEPMRRVPHQHAPSSIPIPLGPPTPKPLKCVYAQHGQHEQCCSLRRSQRTSSSSVRASNQRPALPRPSRRVMPFHRRCGSAKIAPTGPPASGHFAEKKGGSRRRRPQKPATRILLLWRAASNLSPPFQIQKSLAFRLQRPVSLSESPSFPFGLSGIGTPALNSTGRTAVNPTPLLTRQAGSAGLPSKLSRGLTHDP